MNEFMKKLWLDGRFAIALRKRHAFNLVGWAAPASPYRMYRRGGVGLLCFVLCCFFLLGCSANVPSDGNTAKSSQRITVGTTLDPRTLDPADAYEISSFMMLESLGDRLYTYKSGTTEILPQLAADFPTIAPDGLTYTIPLRQGVLFHDGEPFNAAAMKFSLDRFIENNGRPSFLLSDIVKEVKVTGEYELTIELKQTFSAFPALLTFPGLCAVSPKAYADAVGESEFEPKKFVGTGPYELANYRTDGFRLDIFDRYWGEKPKNAGINIQILSSPANLYSAFLTGAIDVAYQSLEPDQIRSLERKAKKNDWQVVSVSGTVVGYMTLNLNQPPLDRLSVRQAIAALVDRELLSDRVFLQQAEPLYSMMPNTFAAYKPVFEERYGNGNVERARELLKEAGFSPENPLVLEIWYPTTSVSRNLASITLKGQFQRDLKDWIRVEIHNVEPATYFKYIEEGTYPTAIVFWYPDFIDPDNYVQPFLSCEKGSEKEGCIEGASQGQGSFYYSDRMNRLIDLSRQESNPEKRKAIFAEIQEALVRDVPFVPLWQSRDYAFAGSNITGLRLEPTSQFPLRTLARKEE